MSGLVASCSDWPPAGRNQQRRQNATWKNRNLSSSYIWIMTCYGLWLYFSCCCFQRIQLYTVDFHHCSMVFHKLSPPVQSKHYLIWYRNHRDSTANFFWHFLNPNTTASDFFSNISKSSEMNNCSCSSKGKPAHTRIKLKNIHQIWMVSLGQQKIISPGSKFLMEFHSFHKFQFLSSLVLNQTEECLTPYVL